MNLKRYRIVLILVVLMIILTSCRTITSGESVVITKKEYEELTALEDRFSKLLELEQQIKSNFYEDTTEVDFDTAILKGLFSALNDPYSTYFTPDEYTEFNQELSGEYVGIGTYINPSSR